MNNLTGSVAAMAVRWGVLAILPVLAGCNWEAPQQEKSLPVASSEVVGFWLHKNKEGESLLDIRENGKYRQVCLRTGDKQPFFDSGWQPWTFYPKDAVPGRDPSIICDNMMDVSADLSDAFGRQWGGMGVAIFKYADGEVALHSGRIDFKKLRPYGDWKRLSREELPAYYNPDDAPE